MEIVDTIESIKNGDSGTITVYHIGSLFMDKKRKNGNQIRILSNAVYELYLSGICALVQKKISEGRYKYIAITLDKEGRSIREKRNRFLHDNLRSETSI